MSKPVLSLNQATTRGYGLVETARAAADAGIEQIGLWIEPVQELGLAKTKALLKETGLGVSSICRVGFVADKSGDELEAALEETRAALDLSAEVGAPALTFIPGGLPQGSVDIHAAQQRVRQSLELLVPDAHKSGVRLAVEPLHPLFVEDRSVIASIAAANRLIADLPSDAVGLMIDSYANWWDSEFDMEITKSAGRVAGFQINDFKLPLPLPELMNGRLFPGDGVIDLQGMYDSICRSGYEGAVEIEIFNDDIWALDLKEIISRCVTSFEKSIVESANLASTRK